MVLRSRLSDVVQLRPVELDDIASVRYVHKTAFEILAGDKHSEDEVKAHIDLIYSQSYTEKVLACNMHCAWVDNQMIGTAGWCPADDNGRTARIKQVFVHPLFNTLGIGRLLVTNAEKRAQKAGFSNFSAQANINAIPFYKRLGYAISSHGIMPTPMNIDLPVAFMRKCLKLKKVVKLPKRLPSMAIETSLCA